MTVGPVVKSIPMGKDSQQSELELTRTLINSGQTKKAEDLIYGRLAKEPQNNSFRIMAMHLEYSRQKFRVAYQQAREVRIRGADPQYRFEYGVIMFTQDDCKGAIRAFSTLAAEDPNASFARFYTGHCQLKQKKWQLASINLKAARGLPPQFNSLRLSYLKRVSAEQKNRGFGRLGSQTSSFRSPSNLDLVPKEGRSRLKLSRAADVADLLDNDQRKYWEIEFSPAIKYLSYSEKNDFGGTGQYEKAGSGPNLALPLSYKYYFGNGGPNSTFHLDLPFRLDYQDIQYENRLVQFRVTDEGDFVLPGQVDIRADQYYSYSAQPGLTWSPRDSFDLTFGLLYEDFFLERSPAKKRNALGPTFAATLQTESYNSNISGKTLQIKDQRYTESPQTYNLQNLDLKANIDLPYDFTIGGSMGLLTHSNPFIEDLYTTQGFSQVAVAQLSLESIFWSRAQLGLQLRGTSKQKRESSFTPSGIYASHGAGFTAGYVFEEYLQSVFRILYDQISNFEQYNLATNAEVTKENPQFTGMSKAQGSMLTFGFSARLQPTEWSFFSIDWQRASQSLSPANSDYSVSFSQKVPSEISRLTYDFGVSKNF